MILFPNCKINLGLQITGKRTDGFHELETVFYPVALKDALEAVIMQADEKTGGLLFSSSGFSITGDPRNNLCARAYQLLEKDFPSIPPVTIHLHKAIPMGAGLGGGSADGTFTLKLLDSLCRLGLTTDQFHQYALQLGSDCPFFLRNTPCLGTGRGEILADVSVDLSGYEIVIVHPGIPISTADAFAGITPRVPEIPVRTAIRLPVTEWKSGLVNDFEESLAGRYPVIASLKQALYNKGAVYASMTGSGSAVYGLFERGKFAGHSFDHKFFVACI